MKRIDFDDNIGAVQDKFGAGKDGWTNGDPADPASGTIPQDYWFDGVQEEILHVIEQAGLAADGGDYTQLYQALTGYPGIIYNFLRSLETQLIFTDMAGDGIPRFSIRDDSQPTSDPERTALVQQLLDGPKNGDGGLAVTVYLTKYGVEFVYNATWNGTSWTSLGPNEGYLRLYLFDGSLGGPRIDVGKTLSGGQFQTFSRVFLSGDPPTAAEQTIFKNTAFLSSIPKVTATINLSGGGNPPNYTISTKSVGVSSISWSSSNPTLGDFEVVFRHPFATTDYQVSATAAGAQVAILGVKQTDRVKIGLISVAAGTTPSVVDLTSEAGVVDIMITGEHA